MDFFGQQHKARRAAWLLAVLFFVATACLILICNLVVMLVQGFVFGPHAAGGALTFAATTVVIGGLTLLGSFIKTRTLIREGGAAIAKGMDGRLVPRSTTDPAEQRLINVVDEMAIAAGMAAVPVFVLNGERGINAFAAGSDAHDAVIAVTSGATQALSRDELQALIGHEFSHIIHGDTRVNFLMIGVLNGISMIHLLGQLSIRASTSSQVKDLLATIFLFCVGSALVAIGYVGHLLAESIKALMCRQNEYAADAAAVQYTRNPEAVVSLLKKTGAHGSYIRHPRVGEASHICIAPGQDEWLGIALHPPLRERIKRIALRADQASPMRLEPDGGKGSRVETTAAAGHNGPHHLQHARMLIEALPVGVLQAARHIEGARQCVFALLLSPQTEVRTRQASLIRQAHGDAFLQQVMSTAEWIDANGPHYRLLVLDLALPTMAELSFHDQRQAMDLCNALINADTHTSVFEQVVRRLLRAHLPGFAARTVSRVNEERLGQDAAIVLSALIGPDAPPQERASSREKAAHHIARLPANLPQPPDAASLNDALDHLANGTPVFRKQVLEGCMAVVIHDGKVSTPEAEVLRAIAQALGFAAPREMHYASDLMDGPRDPA